jgi:membrane fusion protein (multidrug efflux system)
MAFIDVTVDRTTDTVIARATIPNQSGVLIDGQLVRVLLESGEPGEEVYPASETAVSQTAATHAWPD